MSAPVHFTHPAPAQGVDGTASIAPHMGHNWQCLCPGHRLHGVTGAPEDLRAELARDGYQEQAAKPERFTAHTSAAAVSL